MRVGVVFTDLDGTLLEPDGSACQQVQSALAELCERNVPVCPLTSKTAAELTAIREMLDLGTPAGFENGAGVLHGDGTSELQAAAVPLPRLVSILERARRETGAPVRSILELADEELAALTGLGGQALRAARARQATLPLVVDSAWDDPLRRALEPFPNLRIVRGNRFLHLQGDHDKSTVLARLSDLVDNRRGLTVACGDSPNDAELLARADIAVIVPGVEGPHPELVRRFPRARVAPSPHGRGWAAIVRQIVIENAQ
jgi:mannosyl-3-phosphoglycerate phosphatase